MPPLKGVSRETQEKLEKYLELLNKWQAKINLVSPSTLPDAWNRHILDSVQIEPLVPADAKLLYDLGSGAGFPGLVLAMMRPALTVHVVESDSKKCAFMSAVSRETDTKISVQNRRIEAASGAGHAAGGGVVSAAQGGGLSSVEQPLPAPDVVTARALASLSALLDYCSPWIEANPALVLIFPKGEKAALEIAEAREKWVFEHTETVSQIDPASRILRLSNVRRAA